MKELFEPSCIAIIGAAREETKIGHIVLKNLIDSGFSGKLIPINPKSSEILGLKCYRSILDVPGPVDLAVICVPNTYVPNVVEDCGKKGTKAVIIISAGFKEMGKEGAELERRIAEIRQRYDMRILGPNCLGVINTDAHMNATFTRNYPRSGSIAITSQSGAICSTLLDWSSEVKVGFSKFISVGNKVDIDEADLLAYLRDDPQTRVIGLYIEGTDRGIEFMRQADLTTMSKPVIALKSGRTSSGAKAASSHTGALTGSDKVYEAALGQSRMIRAKTLEELFDLLLAFSNLPPVGPGGVAIVTNAGGLGVLAADSCGDYGLNMVTFAAETISKLKSNLPEEANLYNPVDVIGDADAARYEFAIRTVMDDPNVSSVLVLLAPTDLVDIASVANLLAGLSRSALKPLVATFVGGVDAMKGVHILRQAGVPHYESPDRSVRALSAMVEYQRSQHIRTRSQTALVKGDQNSVRLLLDRVRAEGRLSLSESEGKDILSAYGIPVPFEGVAMTEDEAVQLADKIGYPVVLKIESRDISHKTDVGGVVIGVGSAEDVRKQFSLLLSRVASRAPRARIEGASVQQMLSGREVIIGMVRDDSFGPVITFGLGGIFVEVMKDVTQRIAPLSDEDIDDMIRSIKAYPILTGARGKRPADVAALKDVINRLAQIAQDFPEISELEINPVIVMDEGQGVNAVDALVTIKGGSK
jgi:acetyl coenzyme A synthetase (ADP forming)-like protein